MSALRALQRAFQYRALHGIRLEGAMTLAGEAADDRFLIYRRAYFSRLAEALADHYEALHAILGGTRFRSLALAYIARFPSRHRNIRWFGRNLAAFAASHAPWSGETWIADLARFEWNLTLAFDAADVPPATLEDIGAFPPDLWCAAVFQAHPSVRVVRMRTNAPQLRSACESGTPIPDPTSALEAQSWLLWRHGDGVRFRSLPEEERAALVALRRGYAFSDVCAAAIESSSVDEAAGQVATWLQTWVRDGLITGISAAPGCSNEQSAM